MTTPFHAKLGEAMHHNNSRLCIGLDPDPARIPAADDARRFLRSVIDATADLVCCYKPNLAFFEALGRDGYSVLTRVLTAVPPGIPVIGDGKRGDIGNSAAFYAKAMFDVWGFDATTVTPWGGEESLRPFLAYPDHGTFVWCRSSGPGAADLQDLWLAGRGEQRLFEYVAEHVDAWDPSGRAGLVVGATARWDHKSVRVSCPGRLILVPGVGAQGGDLTAAVYDTSDPYGNGFVINASRSVLYADPKGDYAQAARSAALNLRDEINDTRRSWMAATGRTT